MPALLDDIRRRAQVADLAFPDETLARCVDYVELLARWNARINLTALPLTPPVPDHTLDKLVIEGLLAASVIPDTVRSWIDLGSGGGSPALPMRCVHNAGELTLVESRERKGSFLREAVRMLGLPNTRVESVRFETLPPARADLISFRAVRVDATFVSLLTHLLGPSGLVMSFGTPVIDEQFLLERSITLPDGSTLFLCRYLR
jgi:16S rRNA (guanine527-N7)-methyltransferase